MIQPHGGKQVDRVLEGACREDVLASYRGVPKLKEGKDVLLVSESGRPVTVLHLEEKYQYDKDELAEKVFLTMDRAHPGVAKVAAMKDVLLAGPLDLLEVSPTPFDGRTLS